MSLINDALKRAAEADKQRSQGARRTGSRGPKGPEALAPAIQPEALQPAPQRRLEFLLSKTFGLVMLIVVLSCVGAFFIHSWWTSSSQTAQQILPAVTGSPEGMIVKTEEDETDPIVVEGNESGEQIEKKPQESEPVTPSKVQTNGRVALVPALSPTVAVKPPEQPVVDRAAKGSNSVVLPNPPAPKVASTNLIARVPIKPTPSAPVRIEKAPPKKASEVKFPEISVGGIIIKKNSATAYINGKMLNIGSTIDGAELVEISLHYVTFKMNGAEMKFFIAQ